MADTPVAVCGEATAREGNIKEWITRSFRSREALWGRKQQEGPECEGGTAILKQNGQGKSPLRKRWMSKCDGDEGVDRGKSGNGAPGTGTARLEEGLCGHAGGTVPGGGLACAGQGVTGARLGWSLKAGATTVVSTGRDEESQEGFPTS